MWFVVVEDDEIGVEGVVNIVVGVVMYYVMVEMFGVVFDDLVDDGNWVVGFNGFDGVVYCLLSMVDEV